MIHKTGLHATVIPKDPQANVRFRIEVMEKAKTDLQFRACLMRMCEEDILFFCNLFLWTFDPRAQDEGRCPVNPFVTWEIQDDYLTRGRKALGKKDIGVEKSRDQGLTWLTLVLIVHDFVFGTRIDALVASWKEEYVFGDLPKTLFWKIGFMLDSLPIWMQPPMRNTVKSFCNAERNNYINGEATTSDIGRAGRCTYVFLDEFAKMENGYQVEDATRAVTECRIFVSTPRGYNHHKDVMDRTDSGIEKFTIHWTSHPYHSRGLYYTPDGKPRSPWYDTQMARALSNKSIAKELDISYDESTDRLFSEPMIENLLANSCNQSKRVAKGKLEYQKDVNRLVFSIPPVGEEHSPLTLWFKPSDFGGPASGFTYVCGCDISMGNGSKRSSNSVASFWCEQTGEQVAEFVSNAIEPSAFAHTVLPMLHWFSPTAPCHLIWEDNGPGSNFRRVILEAGYPNIHWRDNPARVKGRPTDLPGFWSDDRTKPDMLGTFARMLSEQRAYLRSSDCAMEMRQFVILKGNKIEHQKAANSEDTADAGVNHGDRVVAAALAVWSMWRRGFLKDTLRMDWKQARDPDADMKAYVDRVCSQSSRQLTEKWCA